LKGIIVSDAPKDLRWLLSRLVDNIPYVRAALLFSADGMKEAVHGLGNDAADWLAADASGLWSLAKAYARDFGDSEGDPSALSRLTPQDGAGTASPLPRDTTRPAAVRQVAVETDSGFLFVSAAGYGTALAVVADRGVDPNIVGHEMKKITEQVPSFLATSPRHAAAATPPGRSR
jgi:predicted regulator of Ras-like GTPase activity (Roadblock/LC7/MglB family)